MIDNSDVLIGNCVCFFIPYKKININRSGIFLMKHKGFLAFILLVSCVTAVPAEGGESRWKVKEIEDHADVRKIAYESRETALRRAEQKADVLMLLPADKDSILASVPEGGFITLKLAGKSLKAANPESWTVVVSDLSGHELYRTKGNYKKVKYSGSDTYKSDDHISIPVAVSDSFMVYIIDRIHEVRNEYLITRKLK